MGNDSELKSIINDLERLGFELSRLSFVFDKDSKRVVKVIKHKWTDGGTIEKLKLVNGRREIHYNNSKIAGVEEVCYTSVD